MKRRHKRIGFIIAGLAGLGVAALLAAQAFRSNLVFFYSPSEVVAKAAPVDRTFRVGGLVETGTVKRDNDGLTVRFAVTILPKAFQLSIKAFFRPLQRRQRVCGARSYWAGRRVFMLIRFWLSTTRTTCAGSRKRSTRQKREDCG